MEKSILFKMKEQHRFFSSIRDELKDENDAYKERLKKLSQGFSKRIEEMDESNNELNK